MRTKRLILTVGCVCCILLSPFGCRKDAISADKSQQQNPSIQVAANAPAGAQITFENLSHDFGKIAPSETVSCEFKFKNTGKSLLKIEDVHASCGCTTPELAKKEYQLGESGVVTVKYHAPVKPRSDTKRIFVQSNDAKNPKINLTITAQIVARVAVEPEKLNLSLRQPNAGCPPIKLISQDKLPFFIKHIESTGDCITADFNSVTEANEFGLQPKVDVEKLRQLFGLEGIITIDISHPLCKTVTVSFSATSEFRVEPALVNVSNAEPNKPVTKQVAVRNNYNEPFELEAVTSRLGYTKVISQQKDPNNGYILDLQITPPPPRNRARMFSDVLIAKVKNGESVKINCRGFYAIPPVTSVNTDANKPPK